MARVPRGGDAGGGARRGVRGGRGAGSRALAGTILGNVPGLLLPFLVTWCVGAGRLTDAYFYAFAIAIFVSAVVSLALEATVMPAAMHHGRRGAANVAAFARALAARAVLGTTAVYLIVGALGAGSVLIRDNWTADEQRLCIELIGIFLVYLSAVAATAVLVGTLYAFGAFFVARATIAIRSLLPLPVLAIGGEPEAVLLWSAVALALGELLRVVILARALRRELRALPAPDAAEVEALGPAPSVWSTALPYGLAMVLFALNPVIDRIAAGTLDPGAVTTLDLAEKVFYAPITILMSSVLLVSGARWAQLLLDRPEALHDDFWATVRRSALLSGLVAIVVVPGALSVWALVGDGARAAGIDVQEFCVVLAILMVGFPAALVTNAGVRLLTVLGRTRVFPLMGVCALAFNVAGSFGGAALLGTAGIALSGTVWRTINLVLFLSFSAQALTPRTPWSPERWTSSLSARRSGAAGG